MYERDKEKMVTEWKKKSEQINIFSFPLIIKFLKIEYSSQEYTLTIILFGFISCYFSLLFT